MPFRITQESYRPRVSDRTMVGTLPARSACKFQEPNGVDNGSCHETVAMGTTRSDAPQRKAVQTKRQPARGRAGCARNSTASGEGRKMSLDIPFYRTFPPPRRLLDSSKIQTLKGAFLSHTSPASFRLILRLEKTGGARPPPLRGTGEGCFALQ